MGKRPCNAAFAAAGEYQGATVRDGLLQPSPKPQASAPAQQPGWATTLVTVDVKAKLDVRGTVAKV